MLEIHHCILAAKRPTANSPTPAMFILFKMAALSRSPRKIIVRFCFIFAFALLLPSIRAGENDDESSSDTYRIEGKVTPPDNAPENWRSHTKVFVNGGEFLAFLKADGSFAANNIPSGSYVVEVAHPDYMFEPARVDITSKGKIRSRKLNFVQPSSVLQIPYPLKFKMRAPFKYFHVREQWRVTDFLLSPMVLMMVLPLFLVMVLPKLMTAADPETQREMQQSLQMPKYDMPELSEMVTSLFSGGKKPQPKLKSSTKKRIT